MRRLVRCVLNVLTVLSVLFCVATVAIWVRSRWAMDFVVVELASGPGGHRYRRFELASAGGRCFASAKHGCTEASNRHYPDVFRIAYPVSPLRLGPEWRGPVNWGLGLIRYDRQDTHESESAWQIMAPDWLVAATLAIPSAARWARRRPRAAPKNGQPKASACACGYDLRDARPLSRVRRDPDDEDVMNLLARWLLDGLTLMSFRSCAGSALYWWRSSGTGGHGRRLRKARLGAA